MSKKFASKWFRVAVEGTTSDRRTIKRTWIEQAAKNYKQSTYGARVWLEHLRGLYSDSAFRAYGDVIELKAEEVDINGTRKLALFAKIDPTDDLVAMNKARQKIYTSIEIDESFADTGEAYMVGLAVTDSPASLGTEVLTFAAQKPEASPFSGRHFSETSMFTEAIEADLEFEPVESAGALANLFTRVTELLTGAKKDKSDADQRFADVTAAVELLAGNSAELDQRMKKAEEAEGRYATELSSLNSQIESLGARLSAAENNIQSHQAIFDTEGKSRPPVDGGAQTKTDC